MVRDEAAETIEHLKTHGLRVVTLTGDSEKTAKGIAESLGIEEFYASVAGGKGRQNRGA